MGNRFQNMVGYKAMVTAHGILAAITFLFVVPVAIFMARFYHRNPRTALRFHIWLQILAVLLSTAAIILGFQAVGRERSLTNPHHGIGVALYTLVMVQALGGSVIHRLEKGKERFKIPLKLMVCYRTIHKAQLLIDTDSSMARPIDCASRDYTDPSWSDPFWLSQSALHSICRLGIYPAVTLLHFVLPQPTRDGLRRPDHIHHGAFCQY